MVSRETPHRAASSPILSPSLIRAIPRINLGPISKVKSNLVESLRIADREREQGVAAAPDPEVDRHRADAGGVEEADSEAVAQAREADVVPGGPDVPGPRAGHRAELPEQPVAEAQGGRHRLRPPALVDAVARKEDRPADAELVVDRDLPARQARESVHLRHPTPPDADRPPKGPLGPPVVPGSPEAGQVLLRAQLDAQARARVGAVVQDVVDRPQPDLSHLFGPHWEVETQPWLGLDA